MRRRSVAVIGYGSIGRRHGALLEALGHEVCGYDARGAGVTIDPEPGHDAWVIATPYHSHLAYAEMAALRGVPFLVEKPLGPTREIIAWERLAQRNPVAQVGYMLRFHPFIQQHRSHAEVVRFDVDTDMANWPGVYGDPVLECSHELDLLLWYHRHNAAFTGHRLSNGVLCTGPKGSARIRWRDVAARRDWSVASADGVFVETEPSIDDELYRVQLEYFLARVDDPGAIGPACTLREGAAVLRLTQALYGTRDHSGAAGVDAVPA